MSDGPYLYIFLDEAGNLAFSDTGTRYFALGSVTLMRPFCGYTDLASLKYDLAEEGTTMQHFHASEDAQSVRNRVFGIIGRHLDDMKIDATIVEKRKTAPALQPLKRFYPRMLGYHLRYVLGQYRLSEFRGVLIYTDKLPVQKKRRAVEKAAKTTLAAMLPDQLNYRLIHHESKSNFNLQVADYCTWAIYRKWDRADERSYQHIAPAVRSEFDIFQTGSRYYY